MATRIQGMDTDEVRHQARGMDGQAAAVGEGFAALKSRLAGLNWHGSDFEKFCGDMDTFEPQVHGARRSLEENAGVMRGAADRQDAVSS
ncbi:MAG: hypothetical protein ACRCYR_12845 [Phycicoccus sp.]